MKRCKACGKPVRYATTYLCEDCWVEVQPVSPCPITSISASPAQAILDYVERALLYEQRRELRVAARAKIRWREQHNSRYHRH